MLIEQQSAPCHPLVSQISLVIENIKLTHWASVTPWLEHQSFFSSWQRESRSSMKRLLCWFMHPFHPPASPPQQQSCPGLHYVYGVSWFRSEVIVYKCSLTAMIEGTRAAIADMRITEICMMIWLVRLIGEKLWIRVFECYVNMMTFWMITRGNKD